MAKKRTLTDQLRAAITTADKTMGQIARESGIDIATISRFVHYKGGLSVDGLDRITEALGLNLTTAEPRPMTGRMKKGR
jgi:DNA-binding phage protein